MLDQLLAQADSGAPASSYEAFGTGGAQGVSSTRRRVSAGYLTLPSWAELVADARELYTQVCLQRHLADRRGP
jgi:hypothetical protein